MKTITWRQLTSRFLIMAVLGSFALLILYPLFWMLSTGFRSNAELFLDPFGLPGRLNLNNYLKAWQAGIGKYFFNSVLVTAFSAVLSSLISAFAAYPLSRFRFRLRKPIFLFILSGLMLAPQVSLIANFKLLQTLNIYDTYLALILPYVAFRIPFTTFLLWSYFLTLPKDVEESACIDGCSSTMTLFRMILPMSRPIIATSLLLSARYVWNDFMFSLVFIESSALKTIPYGLNSMKSQADTDWTILLAGLSLSAIPIIILFVALQKQFVRGMTAGAVKG